MKSKTKTKKAKKIKKVLKSKTKGKKRKSKVVVKPEAKTQPSRHHFHVFKSLAAFFIPIVIIGLAASLLRPQTSKAEEFTPYVPYGGWIVSYVPPIPPPFPCPGHTLIRNANIPSLTPFFGVYIPPFSDLLLYDNRNMVIPNSPKIGGYLPIPFPTCPTPYPVFPIFFDAPFFLDGSGAGPSL